MYLTKSDLFGFEITAIKGAFQSGEFGFFITDIANLHDSNVKKFNDIIDENYHVFDNGYITDLRNLKYELYERGIISQEMIERNEAVYVLTEKGYVRLLIMLDDEMSWIMFERFLDQYFGMRKKLKQANSAAK